jgi:hypothetical protein
MPCALQPFADQEKDDDAASICWGESKRRKSPGSALMRSGLMLEASCKKPNLFNRKRTWLSKLLLWVVPLRNCSMR